MSGPEGRSSVLAQRSILVVDDEPALCEMLGRVLLRSGARVTSVHVAQAALDVALQQRFDLVLVDKRLGDDDGFALIAPLLERQPDSAIVLMTGFASTEDSLAALEAGAVGYLLKPFHSLDEVMGELEDVLVRVERRRRASVPPPASTSGGRRTQPPGLEGRAPLVLLALPLDGDRIRLQHALEDRAFSVECLESVAGLVDLLTRRTPDVIVVDGEASPPAGIAALERARALCRRAALVLVGTTPSLEVTTRLLRLGQALFLRRPIADDAAARIERSMSRRSDDRKPGP